LIGFKKSPNHEDAEKLLLWWAEPSTTKRYLESLGGSLLSPMKDLPINYGKYADYLKPMLDDLSATPQWVAEDLAKPELNLLQNDLLEQLILFSTGRSQIEGTNSARKSSNKIGLQPNRK
jgi:ABC-type glycerol-3-phosphate transport system substrate-binding protein